MKELTNLTTVPMAIAEYNRISNYVCACERKTWFGTEKAAKMQKKKKKKSHVSVPNLTAPLTDILYFGTSIPK